MSDFEKIDTHEYHTATGATAVGPAVTPPAWYPDTQAHLNRAALDAIRQAWRYSVLGGQELDRHAMAQAYALIRLTILPGPPED